MSRTYKISDAAFAVLVAVAIALGLIARIVYGPDTAPAAAAPAEEDLSEIDPMSLRLPDWPHERLPPIR